MAYTTIPESTATGGGGSFQGSSIAAAAQTLVPTLTSIWWSPCATVSAELEVQAANNGGSSAVVAGDGGVIRLACAAAANSNQVLKNRNGESIIANARTSKFALATRVKHVNALIAGEQMRMLDILVAATNDTWIGIDGTTSLTNLSYVIEGGAVQSTSVAIGSSYRWLMFVNDGTNFKGYYNDGTATGAFTELFSTASTNLGSGVAFPRFFTTSGAIATEVASFDLDEILLLTEPAS